MTIQVVGIVGAGTMGNGIAQACAVAGLKAVMVDIADVAVQKGLNTIGKSLALEVAHGTDLDLAQRLILEVLEAEPDVLPNPEPAALVSKLGPHGFEITVSWWTSLAPSDAEVRSRLLKAIGEAFRRHGILVPQSHYTQADRKSTRLNSSH